MKPLRALSALGLLAAALAASAAPITYTTSAVASGTLDGASFTNALLTLTAVGDTSIRTVNAFGDYEVPSVVTVSVPGLASDLLAGAPVTLSRPNSFLAGVLNASQNTVVLGAQDATKPGYDMLSDFGPVAGEARSAFGTPFATSRGSLVVTAASTATFSARLASANPTPEPSALAALGLGAVALLRRRKRK